MNKFLVFALIVLAVSATEFQEEEGDVLILKETNFDEAIKQNEFILVEFYAPWCGHCKKLKPELERAAKTLKSGEKSVPIGKVDTTTEPKLGERFEVKGYPTLIFFVNGEAVEYNGGRTDKEIVSWIQKRTGVVTTHIKDQAQFDQFVKDNAVAVVYFGKSESDENWSAFRATAMGIDKLAFGHVFDDDITAGQKTSAGKVVVYKKFDEGRNDYNGPNSAAELKKFIDEKSFATVMEFDDRAIEKVFQQGNPTLFLFHTDTEESKTARTNFDAAAKQLKGGKVIFAVSRPDDGHGHWQRLADYVGINTAKVPAAILVHVSGEVDKYQYSAGFTKDEIVDFVHKYNDGKLSKFFKSEEIPEKNDEPVKILVGKNFQDIVINNNRDVLVEFYAPWCGHCKQLAPIWDELAKDILGNKNIVVAKIDSTANEVPGAQVKGFPTLKFYPGNKKSDPIDVDADRTKEGLITFLKKHTTHPWVESAEKRDDL